MCISISISIFLLENKSDWETIILNIKYSQFVEPISFLRVYVSTATILALTSKFKRWDGVGIRDTLIPLMKIKSQSCGVHTQNAHSVLFIYNFWCHYKWIFVLNYVNIRTMLFNINTDPHTKIVCTITRNHFLFRIS